MTDDDGTNYALSVEFPTDFLEYRTAPSAEEFSERNLQRSKPFKAAENS